MEGDGSRKSFCVFLVLNQIKSVTLCCLLLGSPRCYLIVAASLLESVTIFIYLFLMSLRSRYILSRVRGDLFDLTSNQITRKHRHLVLRLLESKKYPEGRPYQKNKPCKISILSTSKTIPSTANEFPNDI